MWAPGILQQAGCLHALRFCNFIFLQVFSKQTSAIVEVLLGSAVGQFGN